MSGAAAVLLLVLLLLSGTTSRALAAGDFSELAFRPHPGAHLPLAAEFVDEQGRDARLEQVFTGTPVILLLDYLRCKTLCGLTLENLVAALDALPLDAKRDFAVAVLSIDPRDRPGDLAGAKAKYLAGYHHPGDDGGWFFLAGRQATIEQVADTIGFPFRYEPALDQYIHPAGFVVAAPDGRISRYLLGVDIRPATLRAALAEAAQGRAVGLVERLLLLCHGNVPDLGRYGLTIEAAFIISNLVTMAGGVAVFFVIWRRRHG